MNDIRTLGLISANEADGGWVNTVKAGIVWDSRDNRPNPMKGLWTEIGIEVAPKFMGNDWGFSRFYITHRQYFTFIEKDLSFVYRLGYQTPCQERFLSFTSRRLSLQCLPVPQMKDLEVQAL